MLDITKPWAEHNFIATGLKRTNVITVMKTLINTNLKFIHIYLQNNKINSMLYFLRYKYSTPVYISENTCTQTEKKTHTMKETDHKYLVLDYLLVHILVLLTQECGYI
jgi:phosphatidylglycerophosphatase A